MVLSFLGANVRPDDVTSRFGKDLAQSVTGLNRVYNTLANEKLFIGEGIIHSI